MKDHGEPYTFIDPVCFGAAGASKTSPRSAHLRSYLDSRGAQHFSLSQLVATRRVVLSRGTVLDTLGNEWNAVTSGAVHVEDVITRVSMNIVGEPDAADSHVTLLLQAFVEVHMHRVANQLNMIHLLRAVRLARVAFLQLRDALDMISADAQSAVRVKESGVTIWEPVDTSESSMRSWVLALGSLNAITAKGDLADEADSVIAKLMQTADESENEAVELGLVLGWVIQTGFWSEAALKNSLLLDSVYEAGCVISSPGPLDALGHLAEVVNAWVELGKLTLGPKLIISIDDVEPSSGSDSFDHESAGVLNVPRLAKAQRVGRIRVSPGRGLDIPDKDTMVLRGGERGRVRVVGGVLVNKSGWKAEKLKARAELSLRAGAPCVGFSTDIEIGRGRGSVMEEYAVNGMFEGAFGRDAAFWLLGQLRRGMLAIHPDSKVCYARESTMRKRDSAPLVDAGLAPDVVQLLHCYTDGDSVLLDFENNGRLRKVFVGKAGFLSVERNAANYDAKKCRNVPLSQEDACDSSPVRLTFAHVLSWVFGDATVRNLAALRIIRS